jgi:hypothetical protein
MDSAERLLFYTSQFPLWVGSRPLSQAKAAIQRHFQLMAGVRLNPQFITG